MIDPDYDFPSDVEDVFAVGSVAEVHKLLTNSEVELSGQQVSEGTPLEIAIRYLNRPVFEYPLKAGANIEGDAISNVFAFLEVEWVETLLATGRIEMNTPLWAGETPLGIAVRYSNYPVVQYLIGVHADVNAHDRNQGGEPPVKVAYDDGNKRMVEILMEAGADPNLPGWMGISTSDRILSSPRPPR